MTTAGRRISWGLPHGTAAPSHDFAPESCVSEWNCDSGAKCFVTLCAGSCFRTMMRCAPQVVISRLHEAKEEGMRKAKWLIGAMVIAFVFVTISYFVPVGSEWSFRLALSHGPSGDLQFPNRVLHRSASHPVRWCVFGMKLCVGLFLSGPLVCV